MPLLTDPVRLAGQEAPSRVLFGPHETNLGRRRAISNRHVAYYARRAAGGAGVLVTETASVVPEDWPQERAPLAADCADGWRDVAAACSAYGTVVLASLGHTGAQGSTAYSQQVLWAPSPVADVASRELPAQMEQQQIDHLIAGFVSAARLAVDSGLAGVEIDAGAVSLLRQFHSGLTNLRSDGYGTDRLRLTREVLDAVRAAIGPDRVLALRLSCDELAPWAGVTPEMAAVQVDELAERLDLLVVVRGGPFSPTAYRPEAHTPTQFNTDLARAMRVAAAGRVPVVLQGSVVDLGAAQGALDDGVADLVEMTRAQIAEPRLVALVRAGTPDRVRPCILCNQACKVRDNRNPIVSCVGEPSSGHETQDQMVEGTDPHSVEVLVVGGGPAGLEAARVAALRGHRVTLHEQSGVLGGALRQAAVGPGRERLRLLTDWLETECAHLGVAVRLESEVAAEDLKTAAGQGFSVVLATGSTTAGRDFPGAVVLDVREVLTDPAAVPAGVVLVYDPIGGPIGVGVAELLAGLGRDVALVTQDPIAGTLLAIAGDLADANVRLQRAGVRREVRSLLRQVADGSALLEDVWTGEQREIPCAVVVDCGHRLPEEQLYLTAPGTPRAGDCVTPRTVLEAVLEGRRLALDLALRAPLAVGARQ